MGIRYLRSEKNEGGGGRSEREIFVVAREGERSALMRFLKKERLDVKS